jgi:hypothetical protein
MSTSKSKAAKPIKGMENGEGVKTIVSRTDDQNSGQVGARGGGVLIERKFQRRNNITNLPGLIREHARLIALIRNGEIPLDRGEILSRAMGRHKEMVTALEERNQLKAIVEQLRALRGDSSPQLMIDESQGST